MKKKNSKALFYREIAVRNLNGEKLTNLSREFDIPYDTLRSAKKRGFGFSNYDKYRKSVGLWFTSIGNTLVPLRPISVSKEGKKIKAFLRA